jgi:hypothetical protein
MPWGLIAIVGFWGLMIRLWIYHGLKLPLIGAGLWFAGYFIIPSLHLNGPFFLIYQCLLAVVFILIEQFKRESSKMGNIWLDTKK